MTPQLPDDELARLSFHGASGTVTGSCYLLETRRSRVLFECGMFQGGRDADRRNAAPFDFDPSSLTAVVLTHAHIDHSGRLPLLCRRGYRGDIHATRPSAALARIMLTDSAHIQEMDVRYANKRRARRGKDPLEPLYTVEDAEDAIEALVPHAFRVRERLTEDVEIRFVPAGHILGAASVEAWVRDGDVERRIVFSGDLGRDEDPLLVEPEPPAPSEGLAGGDLVLVETTYGDRDHKDTERTMDELVDILAAAQKDGGNVIVPVFAVGRAQEILYFLGKLEREGRVRPRPTYLDSPMAIDVTRLYRRNADCCRDIVDADGPIATEQLAFTRDAQQSMELNGRRGVTILSASGMCDGGRIVHHLKHNLWRPDTQLVIVGYQAQGSLGRRIIDGARNVTILGERVAVRAKVHTLGGFSAHAGQSELLGWCKKAAGANTTFVLVHGEEDRRAAFGKLLGERLGRPTLAPAQGATLALPRAGDDYRWVERPLNGARRGA